MTHDQKPATAKQHQDPSGADAPASWIKASNPHSAKLILAVTAAFIAVAFLCLGFFVNWGLALLALIIMIPGSLSLTILARHPESTGGRSMLGISDPDTLLDPLKTKRQR